MQAKGDATRKALRNGPRKKEEWQDRQKNDWVLVYSSAKVPLAKGHQMHNRLQQDGDPG